MERDPAKRYNSAAEMKAEIDDPSSVIVTGRVERLQAQVPWKQGLQKYRSLILTLLIPLLVILFFVFFVIFHRPPHR